MAANVIVTISYPVKLAKVAAYQKLAEQFARAVNSSQEAVKVSIYASDEKANGFVEIYECTNNESFDNLEDGYDETTHDLIVALADCVEDRQVVRTMTKRI
ncbi:MAG: hypothetical protein ABI778_04005 [Ignavibacteriota bacterium]